MKRQPKMIDHIERIVSEMIKDAIDFDSPYSDAWESLKDKMKQWLTSPVEGEEFFNLITEKSSGGQLIVVVREVLKPERGEMDRTNVYALYRFMQLGDKWDVSQDYDRLDAEEMMHELANNVDYR